MTGPTGTAFGVAIGMLAALESEAVPSGTHQLPLEAPPRLQASTMATFMALLRKDEGLRVRFSRDPHAVMREHGIDPAPFDLHRLDAAGRQRLLIELAQQTDPTKPTDGTSPKPLPDAGKPRNPPAPIYGPPPKPR